MRILVAFLVVLGTGCTRDRAVAPPPPPQVWVGEGSQWNDGDPSRAPDDTWRLRLSLGTAMASGGIVEYPSLQCGGTLDYVGPGTGPEAEPGDVVFRERLTHGIDGCVDGGTVVLRPSGDALLYTWSVEGDPGQATARLERE